MIIHDNLYIAVKWLIAGIGGIIAYLQPTIPFGLICTLAVLVDCFTAWQLCKRVRQRVYGQKPQALAYFTSRKMNRVFHTILHIYLLIIIAFLIDAEIFPMIEMYLANIVAGAFCFCQIWSILENESSENDAQWAKLLQKIMVDKASRHLDIDLSDLGGQKEDKENGPATHAESGRKHEKENDSKDMDVI